MVTFVADGHRTNHAVTPPILGHIRDAVLDCLARCAGGDERPIDPDSPASAGVRPNSVRASSLRPAPTSPASPTISPARTLNVTSRTPARWHVRLRMARASRRLHVRFVPEDRRHLAADHERDERGAVHPDRLPRVDSPAVAQHGDSIGELEDLVEAMADVEHAGPTRAHLADSREQACHVVRRQRRCGLVHDHDACVAAERTRDLDELLFRHRELARRPIGIDLRPGACEQRLRDPPAARPVDAPPARPTLEPQRQVLRDREMRKQGGLLVDGGDPRSRAASGPWAASGAPSIASVPESGWTAPVRILISVDLPAPFSPTMACTSPARRSSDTSRRACTPA